jgi:Uma2 family endonuclease
MAVSTSQPPAGSVNRPVVLFRMDNNQFAALPESEQHLELIDGRVIVSPKLRPRHQKFVGKLFAVLDPWLSEHGLGDLFPGAEVRAADHWTPVPDLSFVRAQHRDRIGETQLLGPIDLAVEVLSPFNEGVDRKDKFEAYARFGIDWYWIVDLQRRVLEEYERVGDAYGNRVDAPFDGPFAPRLFPGLSIDLARLAR